MKAFNPEQARAFTQAIKGERLEALFATAISLACRQGGALGLQWPDVDLEIGTLTVRQALQRVDGKLESMPTKADKVHTITLPAVTISALAAHRLRQDQERQSAAAQWRETGSSSPPELEHRPTPAVLSNFRSNPEGCWATKDSVP